jgi:hypothetical protein
LQKGGFNMTVPAFIGLYFVVSIGAVLFLGRFFRLSNRGVSAAEEGMAVSLFQLDGALRSAPQATSPPVLPCAVQSTQVEESSKAGGPIVN